MLTQLRDLDFDRATGKFNDVDYAAQRAQLVAEGTGILKQLDALGLAAEPPADSIEAAVAELRARRAGSAPPAPKLAGPASLDAAIEARVAERRGAGGLVAPAGANPPGPANLACVECGAEVLPNDRFCPKCGLPLTVNCGNCGRLARAGDQFCAQCGQSLPAAAPGGRQQRPAEAQG